MKVLLHVNYYEGKGRLKGLFDLADKNGYDGVELRWRYAFDDLSQTEYQREVATLKAQYPEMEIVFGGEIDFCRGKENEVEKAIEEYSIFLDWAASQCGTKVMNFFTGSLCSKYGEWFEFHVNGSAVASEYDYERAAEKLRVIGDIAKKYGILIALETHHNYLHDTVKSCKKLMDLTNHSAIGINYDQGNIFIHKHGESITEVFETLNNNIYYAHLKNMIKPKGTSIFAIPVMLAAGHINIRDIYGRLHDCLRSGILALEYPCSGDGIWAARKDIEYVRSLQEYFEQ